MIVSHGEVLLKKLIKFGVSEGIAKASPFVMSLYVASYLEPSSFANFGLLIVYFEIIFIFISLNIQATTRIDFINEETCHFNKIKRIHSRVSFLNFLVIFTFCFLLDSNDIGIALLLAFSALFRTCSSFILSILQCSNRINEYVIVNILYSIILSVSTIILVNFDFGLMSWCYSLLLATITQCIVSILIYGKSEFIKIIVGADRITIKKFFGDDSLGNYTLAFQLSSIIIIFTTVLNLAIVPVIGEKLKSGDNKKVKEILIMSSCIMLSVSVLLYFMTKLFLNLDYFSEYLLIEKYTVYIFVAAVVQSLMLIIINVLYFKGAGKIVAYTIVLLFSSQVIINYIFAEELGVVGIILNSILFNILGSLYFLKKTYPFLNRSEHGNDIKI